MCISVGWLFFFLSFFFFFFFLKKKWSPLSNEVSFFFLWVSPWTIEGQGLRSHRRLEEETLRYTHAYTQTLTRLHTSEHQVYVSTHTTHMRHGADTHTHTPNTRSNLGRPRGQKGERKVCFSSQTSWLLFYRCDTHTHQQTVKYTSHQHGWDTGVGLCYIHLAQQKGWKQNVSIAHCGTFQGDKKVKLGIMWTKLKTTPNPQKMLKPCCDVLFPLLHSECVYISDCFVS